MKRLFDWLYKYSTNWTALFSLILFLGFSALVLPGQSAAAAAYSDGTGSPDTSLFYSSRDLYRMAEAYSQAGRQAYVRARFSFDLAFPLIYTFFLSVCTSWLLNRVLSADSRWRIMNLIPLAGMLFDFLENISAALVIGRYPLETPLVAFLTPIFTFIKWIFVGGSFALLIGLLIPVVYTKMAQPKSGSDN